MISETEIECSHCKRLGHYHSIDTTDEFMKKELNEKLYCLSCYELLSKLEEGQLSSYEVFLRDKSLDGLTIDEKLKKLKKEKKDVIIFSTGHFDCRAILIKNLKYEIVVDVLEENNMYRRGRLVQEKKDIKSVGCFWNKRDDKNRYLNKDGSYITA